MRSKTPSLKHLTIKPTHVCVQNCPYCHARQQLLRESREGPNLTLDDWARVFGEADELGVDYLDISGGEPILYPHLPGLIWEGKQRGWFVSLNSVGWRIPQRVPALEAVCLDQVVLSMLSLDASVQGGIRGNPRSLQIALEALEALRSSPIRVVVHLIVNRHNYTELPEFISFAFAHDVNALALIYPENDAEGGHLLMTPKDIERFRTEILPACAERYLLHRPERDASHDNLSSLYAAHHDGADFSRGVYWADKAGATSVCKKPEEFAIIYPNGDVLPCNSVEYTHTPLAGNVRRTPLTDIWHGDAYRRFRQERMPFCLMCPTKRHTGIAIKTTNNPPYAAPVIRAIPENLPVSRPTSWEDD